MPPTATQSVPTIGRSSFGDITSVAFDQISEPGAYVLHGSGFLVRIPEDALKAGRSPLVDIVSNEPMTMTKLSGNPYITLTKARLIACDLDIEVNF